MSRISKVLKQILISPKKSQNCMFNIYDQMTEQHIEKYVAVVLCSITKNIR